MKRFLILCQDHTLTAACKQWLIESMHLDEAQLALKSLGKAPDGNLVALFFEDLADWIESEISSSTGHSGTPNVVILTDLCGFGVVSPHDLNPLVSVGGWEKVLGLLILGFPEVNWVFINGTPSYLWDLEYQGVVDSHFAICPKQLSDTLEKIGKSLSPPLFDGTGLRDILRKSLKQKKLEFIPCRSDLAVAIDEEREYSWLNAYTAYRFGFRAQAISTYTDMETILGNSEHPNPTLVFEDYFLQFGDHHPDGFSCLRKRDSNFKCLRSSEYRILVTSGHHHGQNREVSEDNSRYLLNLRTEGKWNKELYKPLGGIFNLWKDSGLQRKLRNGGRFGLARGYVWPPKKLDDNKGGHSAPGRLLVIAERLIARAEHLLSYSVNSVPQAVYGAVLATDALELLGGKTPTTSLQALALKHHFEVLAECQFVGMQEHMDVEGRINDITHEIDALCHWFGTKGRQKKVAGWNAELSILNTIITVFRDHNQFDEEQALLVRTRVLHRRLRFSKYPSIAKPLEIFPWYVEKLLTSFQLFITAIIFWILVLGSLYYLSINENYFTWHQGLADAFTSFIGLSPPSDNEFWEATKGWNASFWLVAVTMGLGFVHLGIFISYLYSIISRK